MPSDRHSSGKFRGKKWLAAAVLLASAPSVSVVYAAGLGKLNVLSRLGQPFAAEIDLINVANDELSTLRVNLASPAAYQAANLRFDPALNAVRFSVERRANGSPYIRAISPRSVTEPYLDLLVEVTSQEVKLQRAYAALLDLPESAPVTAAPPAVAAPAPKTNVVAGNAAPAAVIPPRVPQNASVRVQADVTRPAPVAVPKPPAPTPVSNNAAAAPEAKPTQPTNAELPKPAPVAAPTAADAPSVAPTKPDPVEPASEPETQEPQRPAPKAETKPALPTAAPQQGVMDIVKPYLLPVGGAALLAGIGGLFLWGRRKQVPAQVSAPIEPVAQSTPFKSTAPSTRALGAAVGTGGGAVTTAVSPIALRNERSSAEATVANVTDVVDPIDEAKVYLEYGQTEPAEQILREAMNKEPGREDIQILLLDILAARGDKDGFNQLARRLHKQTGGLGAHWKRAMAMGYALDPTYPLYLPDDTTARARSAEQAPSDLSDAPDSPSTRDSLDFDLDKTMVLVNPEVSRPAAAAKSVPDIDFELPLLAVPAADGATIVAATPAPTKDDAGLDIEVDFSGTGLKLIDVPVDKDEPAAGAAPATAATDVQWQEVQQKIELARAYREMGDKEGALDLLREAEREADAGQQAEVQELRRTLQ